MVYMTAPPPPPPPPGAHIAGLICHLCLSCMACKSADNLKRAATLPTMKGCKTYQGGWIQAGADTWLGEHLWAGNGSVQFPDCVSLQAQPPPAYPAASSHLRLPQNYLCFNMHSLSRGASFTYCSGTCCAAKILTTISCTSAHGTCTQETALDMSRAMSGVCYRKKLCC